MKFSVRFLGAGNLLSVATFYGEHRHKRIFSSIRARVLSKVKITFTAGAFKIPEVNRKTECPPDFLLLISPEAQPN